MKLLDTNIVIYAFGGPHPYREPCRELFQDVARGNAGYVIDVELLQEVLHIYSYRADRAQAFAVFDRLLRVFPDPLPVTKGEAVRARELLGKHGQLSPRDAVHLAVVLTRGLEGVVTTDKGMVQVGEVACYDPLHLYPP